MGPEFESPAGHQKSRYPLGYLLFYYWKFEDFNVTQMSVTGDGLTELNLYLRKAQMQTDRPRVPQIIKKPEQSPAPVSFFTFPVPGR